MNLNLMSKTIFSMVSALFFITITCFADLPAHKTTTEGQSQNYDLVKSLSGSNNDFNFDVSVNPILLLLGDFYGSARFGISDQIAMGPDLEYYLWSPLATHYGSTFSYFGIGGEIDFYPNSIRLNTGWVLDAKIKYSSFSFDQFNLGGLNFAAGGGYQWYFYKNFNSLLTLDLNYSQVNLDQFAVVGKSIVYPSVGIRFGYSF